MNYQLQQYEPDLSVPTGTNIENIIVGIEKNDKALYEQALINFLVKEYERFDVIEELKDETKRNQLWKSLVKLASESNENDVLAVVFTVFRIISRDKPSVNKLVDQKWIDLLIKHTGLNDEKFDYTDDTLCKVEEGQKVLWNTLFNSGQLVEKSIENGLLDKILARIKLYDKVHVPDSIKFYDLKFVFYISAISKVAREKLIQSDGLGLLISVLRTILIEPSGNNAQGIPITLNDHKTDIACETLKALFNITINSSSEQEKLPQYRELVAILRSYLLISTDTLDKTWQLRNDVVNLLTNVPVNCYTELLSPVDKSTPLPKSLQYDNMNMIVIHEILMLLEAKFKDQSTIKNQLGIYSPVLTVLLKAASTHRSIRKYLRLQILPPLKDLESRPEEADTLRGHLCKLLTTPITHIRDFVAELLFILCKCNVTRMIKYTGYGNAAGLLAQRGLLGGKRDAEEANYSSDSEDSETEEYAEHKHLINPILGCVEQPHPDPMEGMTEEQKEYEALTLANHIDSLTRSGIIKPCRVGADGRPQPIEHVLQLQEKLKDQHLNDDSDSN